MAEHLPHASSLKRPPARAFSAGQHGTALSDRLASYMLRLAPTEVDLLTVATGKRVVGLKPEWPEILWDLFSLGRVRLLTAGTGAFIEKYGIYPPPEFCGSMVSLFDETMELRHDLTQWGRAFAVFPSTPGNIGAPECGLHFFDRRGVAIHRIFLSSSDSVDALERIAEEYGRHGEESEAESFVEDASAQPRLIPGTGDAEHIAQPSTCLIRRVQNYEIVRALHNCYQERALTRISIGGSGSLQTYRGMIRAIHSNTSWTCVMDGDTVLYIRDAEIAETWIMQSATEEGESLSLTAFAANGRTIATLCAEEFGSLRSDGRWNHLLEGLQDF